MSLESGYHSIATKVNNQFVSRHVFEDKSLMPKRIVTLPASLSGSDAPWILMKLDNGNFSLKARGASVGVLQNKLFAFLLDETNTAEWKINAQPEYGANTYTITLADAGDGWTVSGVEEEQLSVLPIDSLTPKVLFDIVGVSNNND